jgi:hypothetical protein
VNIDEMTEQEVRDYLAECLGWVRINKGSVPVEVPLWERRTKLPGGGVGVEESWCHPVPATLDAAAGRLPEGWWYWINHCGMTDRCVAGQGIRETFVCECVHKTQQHIRVRSEADTERLARFRAAAKAWAVVRKESGR